ncbi:hypothetical protein DPMN_149768 [Dreissena polymorpha]|uniref:Uncharacterized protein n=1 Tax=Dreissena polymorpha TaxID=45954 RepID=A0A9D4FGL7_DREPO|nr:hypothetical protein DPMN_149768 [Dreissena polymorpha]
MNLLTKFHEDRTINVASRVLTRKNAPSPCGHVFQTTRTIFKHVQDIIGTNLLTKFYYDRTMNVASSVLTRFKPPMLCIDRSKADQLIVFNENSILLQQLEKMPRPLGGHVFQPTGTIFKLVQDIIGTNLLTKFHEDQTTNVASSVLTRFNYSHIAMYIKKNTNLLTKFHEDWTINVASRVLTRKNAPPPDGHVFKPTDIIFELEKWQTCFSSKHIIETNLLTKFHEDWIINVASRVLTRQMLTPHNTRRTTDKRRSQKFTMSTLCSEKINAPPPDGHVFQPTDIIRKYVLTKCHTNRTINVASTVITRNMPRPPPGSHVFQPTGTSFELFHDDRTINVASREKCQAPVGHVLQATGTIFKLVQDIMGTNLLTKFHDDWTINLASIEKNAPTSGGHFHDKQTINVASIMKNAPPPGGHVFQLTGTIFKLIQDNIGTNLLTKFYEDRTINAASRVLTRKNAWQPCFSHCAQLVHNFVHFAVRVVANYGGYFIAACGFLAFWTNLLGNNQTRAEKEPEDEDVDNVQRENTADARHIRDLRIKDNTTAIMRAILIQDTVARKAGGARRNRSLRNEAVDNDELNSFRPRLLQNSFQNRMHTDTPDAMIDGGATRNGSFGNGVIDEDAVNFFRARLLPNF